ncbi:MAG: hypothetical protein ABI411_21520 [Tahibacter sp.]
MSTSIVGGRNFFGARPTLPSLRVLTAAFFLVVVTSTSAPLQAQAPADDGLAGLLLPPDELAAAAAGCGIGIAGERITPVAAAAVPLIGLGKWVGGLVASHIKGVVTRRLGMDQEYNRFLALSGQLRQIESQLKALDEKFDRLGDLIKAKEFRQLSNDLAKRFVDPVQNGTHKLEALACEEAAVINAEQMRRDATRAKVARDLALADFGKSCKQESFENIPRNLTAHFKSGESILDRYLDAVILPQRYLTRQHSEELDDFFYRYHLIQIQALRLTAECMLRFSNTGLDPDDAALRDSVADNVYRKENSHYRRAHIDTLPQILPDVLPEGVVLDLQTGMLWWNGADFGAHPFVNPHHLIREHTISLDQNVPVPGGTRRFQLASLTDIEKLAALNAPVPSARRSSTGSDRYPTTLKPFLREIGLDKVVERIPDSGHLSFVWTSDRGVSIRRCYTNIPNTQHLRCYKWYDPHDSLGYNAVTAPANHPVLRGASGTGWAAPVQCQPNQCTKFWNAYPRVISLCKDKDYLDADNRCISDAVLGMWQGPGIYRAAQLPKDRFFTFDLKPLR